MENNHLAPDLNVGNVFNAAWELTKKHFLPILLMVFLAGMLNNLPGSYLYADYFSELLSGNYITEEQWISQQIDSDMAGVFLSLGKMLLLAFLCGFIHVYMNLVRNRMLISAVEKDAVDIVAILKDGTRGYWFFLLCTIALGFIVSFATMLCVIPGIFLLIRLMFVPIIAAHKPELSLTDVFSRSWKMTDGHFFDIFLFGLLVVALNIAGFLACCIGVYVTYVISEFLYVELYRRLSGDEITSSPEQDVKDEYRKNIGGYNRGE